MGIWIEGDHNKITRCKIHDNGWSGYGSASGILIEHGNYNEITHCEVYNNFWNGISAEDAEYTTVDYNIVYNNDHCGINIISDSIQYYGMMERNNIRNNLISLFPQVKNAFFSNYCFDN